MQVENETLTDNLRDSERISVYWLLSWDFLLPWWDLLLVGLMAPKKVLGLNCPLGRSGHGPKMDPFYIVKWKWALLLTQCTWTTELYHQSKVPLGTSDARKKLGIYCIVCPEMPFFPKNAQFSNAILTTLPMDLWKLF